MRTFIKLFSDPATLTEMLDLRRKGWRILDLAKKYTCDTATIVYHCKKWGIKKEAQIVAEPRGIDMRGVFGNAKYADLLERNLLHTNPGKDYQEYLEEEGRKQKISK